MSRICEDCGQAVPDNASACPNCGCPVPPQAEPQKAQATSNNGDAYSGVIDHNVLNAGISTEAEATITVLANTILNWAEILAVLVPILNFIANLIPAINSGSSSAIIGAIVISIITGIIYYFVIKFVAKLIWAIIMLFVNMSTTLKRIELQIKKHASN